MSCKLELPKTDPKSESEIYLLNEFPACLEDLHKKAKQKFGTRLPDSYRLKYEQPNKSARYITTEEDFKQLLNETKRFKLIIDPLSQESVKDSLLEAQKDLKEIKSLNEPTKVSEDSSLKDKLSNSKEIIEEHKEIPFVREAINNTTSEKTQNKISNEPVSTESFDEMVTRKFEEIFQTRLTAEVAKINEKIQALQAELDEVRGLNTQLVQILKSQNLEYLVGSEIAHKEKISKKGSQTEIKTTKKFLCDGCSNNILSGEVRYHCYTCKDFDFCEQCVQTKEHLHGLKKIGEDSSVSKAFCSNCQASYLHDHVDTSKNSKAPSLCKECTGKAKLEESIKTNKLEKSTVKAYKVKLVDVPQQNPTLVPGARYEIAFSIKNSGELAWAEDTALECLSGCHAKEFKLIGAKIPDQEHKLVLDLTAPSQPGIAQSCWRLRYFDAESNQYKYFGPKFTFEVDVKQPESDKPQTIFVEDISLKYPNEIREKAKALLELTGGTDINKLLDYVNRNPSATIEQLAEKLFN